MKVVRDLSVTSAQKVTTLPAGPWNAPWAAPISGDLPGMVADFAADVYGTDGVQTGLSQLVSVARPSPATHFGSTGAIETVGSNVARLVHDPMTLARLGMITEPSGENLLGNSDSPTTQTITVAAELHMLTFFGTGSVMLSGAYSQTQPGIGAFPNQTTLAFVPTSGSLTLTISGEVVFAQLQAADDESSYILSITGPTSRAADDAQISVGSWFNASEGTLVFSGHMDSAVANDRIVEIDTGSTATRLSILWNSGLSKPQFQVWNGGSLQAAIAPSNAAIALDEPFRIAVAYAANNFAVSMNGGTVTTDSTGTVPTGLSVLRLGRSRWGAQSHLTTESMVYYPSRLADADLQALSA
jgi:hypothetical protein